MPKEVDYNSLRERLDGLKDETKYESNNSLKKEPQKTKYQTIKESLKRTDLGGRGTREYMLRYLSTLNKELNKGNVVYAESVARNISQVIASSTSQEDKLKYLEAFNKRIDRGLKYLEKHPSKKNIQAMDKILDYSKMLEKDIDEPSSVDLEKYNKNLRSGLERSLVVLSIGSVLAGIFFLSPNLTGNAIGNMARSSGSILGGILLLLGIVGIFFTIRK